MPGAHENYQVIVTRTVMYIIIFVLHISNLFGSIDCFQETQSVFWISPSWNFLQKTHKVLLHIHVSLSYKIKSEAAVRRCSLK